jgi:hypothetical protein
MSVRSVVKLMVVVSVGVLGCNPRGETISLDEVVRNAEQRFYQVYRADTAGKDQPVVASSLRVVVDTLKEVEGASGQEVSDRYATVGKTLSELATYAGYTSRPALGELAEQWLGLTSAADAPNTRLLISRTYGVLASELEAVGFAIRP